MGKKSRANTTHHRSKHLYVDGEVKRELMELTLGDEEALTGAGLREILDRVKASMVEEQKKIMPSTVIAGPPSPRSRSSASLPPIAILAADR